jgi:phage-related protein
MARTKQTPKRIIKQAASRYKTHKAKLYQPKPTPARLLTNI